MRRLAFAAALIVSSCHPAAEPTPPAHANDSILLESDLPELVATPLAEDPTATTVHRLSNGMTVYISTDRTTPRISTRVAVRAGGRHDPAHATGLAHYLEHMILFKGSDELGTIDHEAEQPHLKAIRALYRKLPNAASAESRAEIFSEIDHHTQAVARTSIPNEVFNLYATLGASGSNAFTDHDRTHYVTEIPSNRFEQWARLESERLLDPVFRLFYPELEAVYEEKNRALDNAQRRQNEATEAALFPSHPYGQLVLGSSEHLKTPAFDEMVAFFERWYRPNNMAIMVAGDVDASVLPTLEATFGRLKPAPVPAREPGDLAGPRGRVESVVVAPGSQYVKLSWRGVAVGSPDAAVVSVMDRLLDDAQVGLLNVDLELTGKVPWATSGYEFLREAGTVHVSAAVRDDATHEQVEALLRGTVAKLANGSATAVQLSAAKTQIAVDRMREQEYPRSRTRRALLAYTRGEAWADVVAEPAKIAAVTLEDVQRVAKRIFSDNYVAGFTRRGPADVVKLPKPKVTPLKFADAVHSPMAEKLLAESVTPIEPRFIERGRDVDEKKTSWGRRIAARNERNGLFDLAVVFDVGHRHLPLLCHALTVFERSGTTTMQPRELQFELYRLGTRVAVECDSEQAAIYVGGIDENFEASVALLRDWLAQPKLEDALVTETVQATLSQRRNQLDHDRAITAALRNFAYFGDRSPQRQHPSNAALRKATAKDLTTTIAALMGFEHALLYAGPRPAAEVDALAPLSSGVKPRPARTVRNYRAIAASEVHVVHRASAQAAISVVFAGEEAARTQLAAAAAGDAYFHDLAFDEIRGARALAYTVNAGIDLGQGHDEVAMWGVVQAQPDKTLDAVPALVELMRRPTIDAVRLAAALSTVRESVRSHRSDPHNVPYEFSERRDAGVDEDPHKIIWNNLDAVDAAALQRLVGRLTSRPAFVTVVGDTSKIDLDGLATIGAVTLHEPDALFSFGAF